MKSLFLSEGKSNLLKFVGIPFGQLFTPDELFDLKTDKGIVGKLIEKTIGLQNTSSTLDFDDGELKTNKCFRDGRPKETIFITQISSAFDHIIGGGRFEDTTLFLKIQNMLCVPVCKEGETAEWFLLPPIHVDLSRPEWSNVSNQIEEDYYFIAEQLRYHIETSNDGFIHTSNGELIQVRSKDGKPYNPIYSDIYGREISNKNHAFYFKKSFMNYLQELSDDYPYY